MCGYGEKVTEGNEGVEETYCVMNEFAWSQ